MDKVVEKYDFDPCKPIGSPYEDAEVKNHSYKAVRKADQTQVHLVVYQSSKSGQIHSYHKRISKISAVVHPNLTPVLECIKDTDKNMLFVVLEWN